MTKIIIIGENEYQEAVTCTVECLGDAERRCKDMIHELNKIMAAINGTGDQELAEKTIPLVRETRLKHINKLRQIRAAQSIEQLLGNAVR